MMFKLRTSAGPLKRHNPSIECVFRWLKQHFLCFSYILNVPFDSADQNGIVYVWMGGRCNSEEARIAEELAEEMFGVGHSVISEAKGSNWLLF